MKMQSPLPQLCTNWTDHAHRSRPGELCLPVPQLAFTGLTDCGEPGYITCTPSSMTILFLASHSLGCQAMEAAPPLPWVTYIEPDKIWENRPVMVFSPLP